MKLSFGMIFSIVLIVIFLVFAFFAIKKFLGVQRDITAGKFLEDFEKDIEKAWKGSQSSEEVEYSLPSGVMSVCFVDFNSAKKGRNSNFYDELELAFYGDENFIFYPLGSSTIDSKKIQHIDLEEMTFEENPFCISEENEKIKMIIKKDYGNALVMITK